MTIEIHITTLVLLLVLLLILIITHVMNYILIKKEKVKLAKEKQREDEFYQFTNSDYQLALAQKIGRIALWELHLETDTFIYDKDFYNVLGLSKERITPSMSSWENHLIPQNYESFITSRNKIIDNADNGNFFENYVQITSEKGISHNYLLKALVTIRNTEGKALKLSGAFIDVETILQTQKQLQALLEFDVTTNAKTRVYFQERIKEAEAVGMHPISFIYYDVDGLKLVNDTMGLVTGDKLLHDSVSIIRSAIRASDMIARVGSDEFVVFLHSCDEEILQRLCKKIDSLLEKHNEDVANLPIFISYAGMTANMRFTKWNEIFISLEAEVHQKKMSTSEEKSTIIKNWLTSNNYTNNTKTTIGQ